MWLWFLLLYTKILGKFQKKGIGFPTTVSVNNCVAHFTPIPSDPEAATTLKEGDVAKM